MNDKKKYLIAATDMQKASLLVIVFGVIISNMYIIMGAGFILLAAFIQEYIWRNQP